MFNADFFAGNRQRLYKQLNPDGFLVLTANGQMQYADDQAGVFKQESNFWYLTGINQPDWQLLVDLVNRREYLIAPQLELYQEVFDGSLSMQMAAEISGLKEVIKRKEGNALLKNLLAKNKLVYTIAPRPRKYYGFYTNRAQYDLVKKLKQVEIVDIRLILAKIRAIKQPAEIDAIQKAIDITVAGIQTVVKQLPHIKYEYEVEALLNYEFRRHGSSRQAFESIIASGENSQILHYTANNCEIKKPTWLLMDVGAGYSEYCGDISRTIPLGNPTKRQQDVFDAVLRVHDKTIKLCQAGMSVNDYISGFEQAMGEELINLGLIKEFGGRDVVYEWMPHAISHGLGIDAHDSLGQAKTLQEGMVLTVEPGIYIKKDGIGVRIEDDVLITKNGPVVMSAKLPTKLQL